MNFLDPKKLAAVHPACYAMFASRGRWKPAPHLLKLNSEILELMNSCRRILIVNMPPRHGKSEFISKYFPAWYLGAYPDKRIILTSYEASFAASWGAKVRDLLQESGNDIFGIELSKTSASDLTISGKQGGMSCAGAGGPITGKGADMLIIDDPVKNDEEANSRAMRDKTAEWFKSTALTRLEPGGKVILVMTRWHEDDLAGRLLSEEAFSDDISLLNFPAIAGDHDKLGRMPGEALWPDRFSEESLLRIKENIGSYWFSALYQQKPSPAGGGIFKRQDFKYFSEDENAYYLKSAGRNDIIHKNSCRIFAVADLATSMSEKSDFTVILVFALSKNNEILVLDIIRERFSGSEHLQLIRKVHERWNPVLIGIESVQYQISLVQNAMKEGLPVRELKADRDKLSRALPMAAKVESGMVYFRSNSGWLPEFEKELSEFPSGMHDDQADAFAYIDQLISPVTGVMPAAARIRRKSSI